MPDPLKPPPGWPTIDDIEGPYVPTAYARPRDPWAQPAAALVPDAFMQGLDGQPVPLYARPIPVPPPAVPETFTGARGLDPWTQRILAAGAISPLVGWGGSMLFGAIAGATTALGYLAACLAIGFVLRATAGGGGGRTSVNIRIDNRR